MSTKAMKPVHTQIMRPVSPVSVLSLSRSCIVDTAPRARQRRACAGGIPPRSLPWAMARDPALSPFPVKNRL
jgi:hypothetical protein